MHYKVSAKVSSVILFQRKWLIAFSINLFKVHHIQCHISAVLGSTVNPQLPNVQYDRNCCLGPK